MRHIVKILILSTILTGTMSSAIWGQVYSGVVKVDTVEAVPGEHVAVPVRLSNSDAPISGLTVPLKFSSPDLTVDSISFEGSILPSDFDGHVVVDNVSGEIGISYVAKFDIQAFQKAREICAAYLLIHY